MKPGRELDALVAEKVMGFTKDEIGIWKQHEIGDGHLFSTLLPEYSTDIAAAWKVIEMLDQHIELIRTSVDPQHISEIKTMKYTVKIPVTCSDVVITVSDETAPLAICLAALELIMGTKYEAR